jgi:hypothetical protein
MSSAGTDLFRRLELEDNEILKELDSVHGDNEKTLEIYAKRASLYQRFATETTDPIIQQIILIRHDIVLLFSALTNTRHELQTDIARLTSRMDELGSKQSSQ